VVHDLRSVEFDAPVIEERAEGAPTGQRIPDRISKAAAGRDAAKRHLEPGLHSPDQRQRLGAPHALPRFGGLALAGGFESLELGNGIKCWLGSGGPLIGQPPRPLSTRRKFSGGLGGNKKGAPPMPPQRLRGCRLLTSAARGRPLLTTLALYPGLGWPIKS